MQRLKVRVSEMVILVVQNLLLTLAVDDGMSGCLLAAWLVLNLSGLKRHLREGPRCAVIRYLGLF